MIDKDKYIQEVEKQIDEWLGDIYKLRIVTEDVGWKDPDRQMYYYQVIEKLTAKESEVADKLALLKDSNLDDWQVNKDEIDLLRKEVTEAISEARSRVT